MANNVSEPFLNFSSNQATDRCFDLKSRAWLETYLAKDILQSLKAKTIVNSLAATLTVFLNTLVIATVITRRQLRSNSNILLACLAGTDFLVGILVQPLYIASDIKHYLGLGPYCHFDHGAVSAFKLVCLASLNIRALISCERYVAIKHALRYQAIVTHKRLKTGVLLAWAVSIVVTGPYIFLIATDSQEPSAYFMYYIGKTVLAIALVNISAIIYTNGYIYSETRRQEKRLHDEQITQEEAKRFRRDNKAAKTVTIIVGALIVSYLPSLVYHGVSMILNVNVEDDVWYASRAWCDTCVMLCSLFNPIIYCCRLKKFRSAFFELLHLWPIQMNPDLELVQIPCPQQPAIHNQPLNWVGQEPGPVLMQFSALQPGNQCAAEQGHLQQKKHGLTRVE